VSVHRIRIERKFDDDYLDVSEILQPGEAREAHAALARDWRSASYPSPTTRPAFASLAPTLDSTLSATRDAWNRSPTSP